MPANWAQTQQKAEGAGGCVTGGSNDWYQYAPTEQDFNRYIRATGSNRIQQTTRNPLGAKVGAPNLLRTQPPVPLTRSPGCDGPWFGGSSLRVDIMDSIGCGPVPGGC